MPPVLTFSAIPLLSLGACGLADDPPAVRTPAPTVDKPACGELQGLVQYYSLDREDRGSYHDPGYGRQDPAHRPASTRVEYDYHAGCGVNVSDHTHTWHTEEFCEHFGLENTSRYLEGPGECASGGCFALSGLPDPLKFMHDTAGNDGTGVSLGTEASFFAWVELTPPDGGLGVAQRILRCQHLSFSASLEEGPEGQATIGPGIELGAAVGCGVRLSPRSQRAVDPGHLSFVGLTLRRGSAETAEIAFYVDGDLLERQDVTLSSAVDGPCEPLFVEGFETTLESLGDRLHGRLDEVLVFDRWLERGEVEGLFARYGGA